MAPDGEEHEVGESLEELEQRMLELERDLRQGSAQDAALAAGTPPDEPGTPEAPTPEEAGDGDGAGPAEPKRARRGLLLLLGALLLIAAVAAAAATGLFGGGSEPTTPTTPAAPPTGVAATPQTLATAGGGLASVPGLREATETAARADLCAGRLAGAIVLTPPGAAPWACTGSPLRRAAAIPVSATGWARSPKAGGGCVRLSQATELDRRRDSGLTAARQAAVARVPRRRGYAAGTRFDRANGLRLLAVAAGPSARCVRPRPSTLRNGSYPLTTTLVLYATDAGAATADVAAAQAELAKAFPGTPPVDAVVLR